MSHSLGTQIGVFCSYFVDSAFLSCVYFFRGTRFKKKQLFQISLEWAIVPLLWLHLRHTSLIQLPRYLYLFLLSTYISCGGSLLLALVPFDAVSRELGFQDLQLLPLTQFCSSMCLSIYKISMWKVHYCSNNNADLLCQYHPNTPMQSQCLPQSDASSVTKAPSWAPFLAIVMMRDLKPVVIRSCLLFVSLLSLLFLGISLFLSVLSALRWPCLHYFLPDLKKFLWF